MQKFILLYKGPVTSPDASHAGWPEWFGKMGERLVEKGSPLTNGFTVQYDKTIIAMATSFNGFSIIQAEDRNEVSELIQDHPYLSLGANYSIEIFELP